MIIGLITGHLVNVESLRILTIPLTFIMIYPSMIALNPKSIIFSKEDFRTQVLSLFINFLFMPALALSIAITFFTYDNAIILAFLMIGTLPTTGMTLSWISYSEGDIEEGLKIMIIGILLSSFIAPLYIKIVLHKVMYIPVIDIFFNIIFIVIVSLITGHITHQILVEHYGKSKYECEIKEKLSSFSVFGIIGMVFVVMSTQSSFIVQNYGKLFLLIVPIIIFYIISYLFVSAIGLKLLGWKKGSALIFGTVIRNYPLALSIALIVFSKDNQIILLLLSFGYMVQIESAALFVRYYHDSEKYMNKMLKF